MRPAVLFPALLSITAILVLLGSLPLGSLPVAAQPARAPAGGEKRIALVMGNGNYKESPLRNPVNDARAMATALQGLGFEVIKRENAGQRDMNQAITEFSNKLLVSGGVGLFYYAGHGMQVKGRNYLLPVDAEIKSEIAVRNEAIDVDQILEGMASANNPLNVVILDACRNNPFERRFRGAAGGLAQIDAPKGALIAYATAPGKVAADGDGANGLYTAEVLRAISEPNLRIEEVFKRVRSRVSAATNDLQVPWEASSLVGDFYFRIVADDTAFELAFWQSIQSSSDPRDFQSYLEQFPRGRFAGLARNRLGSAAAAAPAPAPPPSPSPSAPAGATRPAAPIAATPAPVPPAPAVSPPPPTAPPVAALSITPSPAAPPPTYASPAYAPPTYAPPAYAPAIATPPPVAASPQVAVAVPSASDLEGKWSGRGSGWTIDLTVRGGEAVGTVGCESQLYRVRGRVDGETVVATGNRVVGAAGSAMAANVRGPLSSPTVVAPGMSGFSGCAEETVRLRREGR
jgi:hypothetical protein